MFDFGIENIARSRSGRFWRIQLKDGVLAFWEPYEQQISYRYIGHGTTVHIIFDEERPAAQR